MTEDALQSDRPGDWSAGLDQSAVMRAAWYGLSVLIVAMVLSLINLQLIYVLSEAFKNDLGLSDSQVGMLTGLALGMTLAVMTLPMGWLSDRVDRRWLLAACILIWCAGTAGLGVSQTFVQMFVAVMGVAVGEAVLGPIVYSIIPDLFPERRRVLANYVFFTATILGASIGLSLSGALIAGVEALQGAGGLLPASIEAWRITLIASAIPGIPVALAMLTVKLERRGKIGGAPGEWRMIADFFARNVRTLAGVFVGFGLSYSAKSTMFIWAPPLLIRSYDQAGASVGVNLGLITAASAVIGVVGSGIAFRMLSARLEEKTAPIIAQISLAIAAVVLLGLLWTQTVWQVYGVLLVFGAASTAAMSLSPTMLQDISPAPIRGRVVALGGVLAVLFGALTPVAVGAASDLLTGSTAGLARAMVFVGTPCLIVSVAVLALVLPAIRGTVAEARRLS